MSNNLPNKPVLQSFGSLPAQNTRQSIESMVKKYEELKTRYEGLKELMQIKDQEHKSEVEALRAKVEENKKQIRKLEDDNLSLQFKVSSLREKNSQQAKDLVEMKNLAKKLYKRLNADPNSKSSEFNNMSPDTSAQKLLMKGESRFVTNSDDFSLDSPQSEKLSSPLTIRANSATTPASADSVSKGIEQRTSARKSNFGKNAEIFQPLTQVKEETDQPVQVETKKTTPQLHLENEVQDKSSGLAASAEECKISSEEHSPAHVIPVLSRIGTIRSSMRHSTNMTTLNLEATRLSSGQPIENGEYIKKFNRLSTIVSLGIRPEITMEAEDPSPLMKNALEVDPNNQAKVAVLRYVSKPSLIDELHSPNLLKRQTAKMANKTKLFEDFFVLGIDEEDLKVFMQENPDQTSTTLNAKILFNYPTDVSLRKEPPRNSIPDFAFPFGVKAHKIKLSNSFGQLESTIYTSSQSNLQSSCFVFPLLSSQLGEAAPKMNEVIEEANPNHLLYILCISFKDFINMSDKSQPRKKLEEANYWHVRKMMCFMTYYPFINFFFDALIKILEILKFERMVKISQRDNNDITRYDDIDASFTTICIENIIKENLERLLNSKPPTFGGYFDFEFQANSMQPPKISLALTDRSHAYTLEAIWACGLVFNYITLKDLIWLLTAMMYERKIVFLSRNIHLLTATLSVMRSLIKPFKYPFPIIHNLPELLMVLCDAPGAAIIGISKGEEYLKNEGLFRDYPSCIYVCLDEEKLYMESEPPFDLPRFDNFEKNLFTHYSRLNPNTNYQIVKQLVKPAPNNPVVKKKDLKYFTDNSEKITCVGILELFKSTLQDKILRHIPYEPIYKDKQLDYEAIIEIVMSKSNDTDKPFLRLFLQTQIFTYYLEQFYEE